MGYCIVIAGQKGGVGKTTITVQLAGKFIEHGEVLIIDTDQQQSLLTFKGLKENGYKPTIISMLKPVLHEKSQVPALKKKYDFIIIDTPPKLEDILKSALLVADLVIVPTTPSAFDIWSAKDTLNLIEQAKMYNPNMREFLLATRVKPKTVIGREIGGTLAKYQKPILSTRIFERVALAESILSGQSIFDYAPESQAAQEFEDLAKEILKIINSEILKR